MLDIDKIWNNLYQGSKPPGGTILKSKGFDVLVLAARQHQDARMYPGIRVICVPGDDSDDPEVLARVLPMWERAGLDVANCVKANQRVLVTCMAGLNRSGFITTIALHHLTGWDGATCVDHIQSRRTDALCNPMFVRYLCNNIQAKLDE